MEEEGETTHAPAPTWGSTMNLASGYSSTTTLSHPDLPPPLRLLEMRSSPEGSIEQSRDNRSRIAKEASSPVEDFSSPSKPSQSSGWGGVEYAASGGERLGNIAEEEDRVTFEIDGTPVVARVGAWEVPNLHERQATVVDIDPNGDDDQIALQIESVVAKERELKRRRIESERPASSVPSQDSYITASRPPRTSTPPSKRQRRGRSSPPISIEKQSSPPLRTAVASAASTTADRQSDESQDLSDLLDPVTILSDPFGEASINSITRYVGASPLIPNFLKEEIVRCIIAKVVQHSQSQDSKSDSDTQEDGYLKTKSFWAFELLRYCNGKITAGSSLTSEVLAKDMTMVLHISSDVLSYGLQMLDRGTLMMTRNEIRSNPWFDGHGHPFNVVYQKPINSINNDASTLVLTQASAEQLSLLQGEIEQLSEEKRSALSAQEDAERKWKDSLATNSSIQEDNDFLREQYSEASNMATKLAKSTTLLEEEVSSLKVKLSTGMQSVQAFYKTRIETLQTRLKVSQGQLNLLKHQNRLTNDTIREKAAKWDADQAKKRARDEELEKKKGEVDEERAALYQAMQEEDRRRAIELGKAPHERFLEIDLADQKETFEDLSVVVDDDELAMLKAEAGQSAIDIVDVSAPRSSRRRANRVVEYTSIEQQSIADTIAQTQEQAQAEMADLLQGELAYHHNTSSTVSNGDSAAAALCIE